MLDFIVRTARALPGKRTYLLCGAYVGLRVLAAVYDPVSAWADEMIRIHGLDAAFLAVLTSRLAKKR